LGDIISRKKLKSRIGQNKIAQFFLSIWCTISD